MANYDRLAFIYDPLNRLIFGSSTIEAQKWLLQFVPENARILIAGGGTGWILDELAKQNYTGLDITYIESSGKMLQQAKKRKELKNKIHFNHQPIESFSSNQGFDIVILPFLLDNFLTTTAEEVIYKITSFLNPNGLLLIADFTLSETGKIWQKVFLKLMYLFFRITCRIEASSLPDIENIVTRSNYHQLCHKTFFRGFIQSSVYQLVNDP
jgi:ubiquinone/menaquinone biosynthesis C-methylase UbiE